MKKNKFIYVAISYVIIMLVLVGCGSVSTSQDTASYQSSNLNYSPAGYSAEVAFTSSADSKQTTTEVDSVQQTSIQQKLIYKGDVNIETKQFEQTLQIINASLNSAGGYIVSQEDHTGNSNYLYTTLTIRVPSQHFFSWLEGVEQIPDVKLSKHIYTEDVSEQYVDLKAREKAKQVVIDKYIEYMALAKTADELIRFTNELAALQEEMESVQARLRYLDHQVNYSLINLSVRQSTNASFLAELNLGSTIKHSFESGIRGFVGIAGFMVTAIIVLLPFAILTIAIWAVIYVFVRKNRKKLANQQPLTQSNQKTNHESTPTSDTKQNSDSIEDR